MDINRNKKKRNQSIQSKRKDLEVDKGLPEKN